MFKKIFHKALHHVWHSRWQRFYSKSHWHLVLDLSLLIVIICLLAALSAFVFYRPARNWLSSLAGPVVDLNNPPLSWDYSVVNSVVDMASGVTLKIDFKNNGPITATDPIIDILTVNPDFTLNRLEKVSGDSVFVNGRQLIFQSLNAGDGGEAVVKAYFTAKNPGARIINWTAQSQYTISNQVLKQSTVLPELKLGADLKVTSSIYYTSPQGDQLGVGPVPPMVGIPTSYWVFWDVKNSGNFKDLVFSGYLPKGVELGEGRSLLVGDFKYNPSSRQIVWKVPELLDQNDSYRLGFEIKIIPTSEQVGEVLPLINDVRYYAVDSLTGSARSGNLDGLTTNLETDNFNSGKGKVVNQ